MTANGGHSRVIYVLSQVSLARAVSSSERVERSWRFPTLLDCYDFTVELLVREFGFSVLAAERAALAEPVRRAGFSFVIRREEMERAQPSSRHTRPTSAGRRSAQQDSRQRRTRDECA